jgi:hypothetical protein
MKTTVIVSVLFVLAVSAEAAPQREQGGQAGRGGRPEVPPPPRQDPATLKRDAQGHPDFTGMWNNQLSLLKTSSDGFTVSRFGGHLKFQIAAASRVEARLAKTKTESRFVFAGVDMESLLPRHASGDYGMR